MASLYGTFNGISYARTGYEYNSLVNVTGTKTTPLKKQDRF